MKEKTKKVLEIMAWIAGTIAILLALYGVLRSYGVV